jgi:radical SAM superfamily enzyme YgiQ (UPF0313 family)
MSAKVLLNCFPPTSLYMPAIGCEVLKSYLSKNNKINTEIVYWNHIFQQLYDDPCKNDKLLQPQDDLHQVLPFLSILAENSSNHKIRDRIILKMQEAAPSFKTMGINYYKEKYNKLINKVHEIIKSQLNTLLTDDVLLFGVSAKFDAWIPGIIVAQEVKKIRPDIKCIIGGIEEVGAAKELFNSFDVFDFAIWGEGEIPTSLLIEKLLENNEDYKNIPRLLHRKDDVNEIINRATYIESNESYYDIQQYININYNNYFKYAETIEKEKIQLPIEVSRGCRWSKCNFCALNWGYTYRTQDFDVVAEQIKQQYLKYKITRFFFVDNDAVGKNIKLFENFLDTLISLSSELGVDFDFHADIIHLNFNKRLIKKLSLAGFKSIQIGYEGVSDSMLKKLNKSTTFADNILFLKFAQKYDVELTITGLIIGIPHEVEEDIIESINNLHYLRFFLGEKKDKLQHRLNDLMLFFETGFWKMLNESERKEFDKHPLNEFLSEELLDNINVKYSLLGQYKTPALMDKWNSFKIINDHYEKSDYKYCLIENNNVINYLEYKDNLKTESLLFDQPEYWDVLRIANDEVINFRTLFKKMSEKHENISEDKLREIIQDLNNSYLLYSSIDNSKMVSIIDTENL